MVSEFAAFQQVHPTPITLRMMPLQVGAKTVFESGTAKAADDEPSSAGLYERIGRLMIELDWVKKSGRTRRLSAGRGSSRVIAV
jgi:transposase